MLPVLQETTSSRTEYRLLIERGATAPMASWQVISDRLSPARRDELTPLLITSEPDGGVLAAELVSLRAQLDARPAVVSRPRGVLTGDSTGGDA